jgi:exopolysaccharide production protein ExoQ
MRISLKFLGDAFTIVVLFLGTGAFMSLMMDTSDPNKVTDGSLLMQLGWSLIYIVVLVRAVPLRREIRQVVKANKALLFLVLLAILSAAWSQDAGLTIRRSLAVLATTLFGLDFAVRYSIREQVRLFGTALGLAVAISVVVEIFFHGLVPTVDTAYPDAWNGAFVQKNDFARFIVLTGILVLIRTRTTTRKFLVGVGAVAGSIALILLCHSRTALVVFMAMLVLLRVFRLRRRGSRALMAGIAGVLIVSGLLSVVVDLDSMAGLLGRDATLTGRTNIWALALESIAERPLLGYGYSAFWNVATEADRISTTLHWKVPHAHNGFIDLTLQLGLVGIALYIVVYVIAVRRALSFAFSDPRQEAMWPLAYLAFVLLYQVTESTIFVGNTILWMFYVSIVCSLGVASPVVSAFSDTESILEPVPSFAGGKEYV